MRVIKAMEEDEIYMSGVTNLGAITTLVRIYWPKTELDYRDNQVSILADIELMECNPVFTRVIDPLYLSGSGPYLT